MASEIPITYEIVLELPTGSTRSPTHVEIGVMFVRMQITIKDHGWAPQVLYCKDLKTGASYTRDQVARILHPQRLKIAIETLRWLAENDKLEPEQDEQIKQLFGEEYA